METGGEEKKHPKKKEKGGKKNQQDLKPKEKLPVCLPACTAGSTLRGWVRSVELRIHSNGAGGSNLAGGSEETMAVGPEVLDPPWGGAGLGAAGGAVPTQRRAGRGQEGAESECVTGLGAAVLGRALLCELS